MLMGIATVLVGLLPSANTLGSAAGWLLVALRFIQGVGVGGEWGGAVLLSMEIASPDHIAVSWPVCRISVFRWVS